MVDVVKVDILTNSSGAFSKKLALAHGALVQYRYVPAQANALDTGADLTITGSMTGFAYVNQSNIGTAAFQKVVRLGTSDEAGNALLYQDLGEGVADVAYVAEPLTVDIANGGDTKSGTLYIWIA